MYAFGEVHLLKTISLANFAEADQLVVYGMIGQALQDIDEPIIGVDIVLGTGGEERIDHGRIVGRVVRTGEQIVFLAQGDRADGILGQVNQIERTTSKVR